MNVVDGENWTGGWSMMDPQGDYYRRFLRRAGGFILWSGWDGQVLVLDESTGEFTNFSLPAMAPGAVDGRRQQRAPPLYESRVVGGGVAAGGVRIVLMVGGTDIGVLTWVHGAMECTVERRVGLRQLANIEASPGLSWLFVDNAATASTELVLGALVSAASTMKMKVFSLDVENTKLHRMKKSMALRAQRVFPYELLWPQTINACL